MVGEDTGTWKRKEEAGVEDVWGSLLAGQVRVYISSKSRHSIREVADYMLFFMLN